MTAKKNSPPPRKPVHLPIAKSPETPIEGLSYDTGTGWSYTGTELESIAGLIDMSRSVLVLPDQFFIGGTHALCWACGETVPVITLFAPYGYFGFMNEDEPEFHFLESPVKLTDVTELPEPVLRHIESSGLPFRKGYSRAAGQSKWGNYCPHCGKLQGEFYLHSEPDSPFWVEYPEDAEKILLATFLLPSGFLFPGEFSFSEWSPDVLEHSPVVPLLDFTKELGFGEHSGREDS